MPRVAIPIGDPAGIGPEISIKTALDPAVLAMCVPTLIGDKQALEFHALCAGLSLSTIDIKERKQLKAGELKVGEIQAAHGRAALDSAEAAIRGAMAGEFDAVVAAPHTESAVHAAGIEFDGYPSFVARVAGLAPEDGTLMLCFEHQGREIRIAHVTLHLSVARALAMITAERIRYTIEAVDATLKKIGIGKPRILVSGINPHAGEGGLFGDEEIRIVAPAISTTRRAAGIAADGPIGADTMLQKAGYDAYVVMLHDQGHIPAKALAPNRVAGLTIGTPVLFSSVAHGSALDIAGQGRAQHGAMVEAITRLVGRRRRALKT
jgi:4-hydroxy-L-threonine phosphate dehydrogenase PdxA